MLCTQFFCRRNLFIVSYVNKARVSVLRHFSSPTSEKGGTKKKDKKELRKALTIIGQCLIDKMCREAVLRTGDPVVKYEYPS